LTAAKLLEDMNLARPSIEALNGAFGRAVRSLFRGLVRRSLPMLEGVAELPGLHNSVEVLRDRFGVPQIFAESEWNLFFAQGYVHAQDRFFRWSYSAGSGTDASRSSSAKAPSSSTASPARSDSVE
jgi:hypothetical protein